MLERRAEAADPIAGTRPRAALPALCVTQITSWGILYYAFPVLLPTITADTGWSTPTTSAAFTVGLIASALIGIPLGRVLDHRGPQQVMTIGALIGTAALVIIATAPNLIAFTIGWLIAGVAMAATFYQAAFAALTRWYRSGRVRALTTLTLAGGLASTVFAPVTATLAAAIGWRHTLLTLSIVLLLIVTPLHWFGLRGPWPSIDSTRSDAADGSYDAGDLDDSDDVDNSGDVRAHPSPRATEGTPPAVTRSRPFWVLTAALTLSGFAMYAVVFNLIPLLLDRGASPAQAAWALGLGGLGQTLGRLLYSPIAHRTTPARRTAVLILAGGVTTLAIALIPGPLWLLTVGAMVAGMVRGNLTLLQATAVTDRWGTNQYARLTAILSAPITIAAALAPWAGSLIADQLNSYGRLFITLTAISAVAAVLAVAAPTRRLPRSKHAS